MVLAQEAMVVAIGWQVYDLSRQTMGLKESAFRLGLIGVVQFLPLLLLTLVVGWVVDHIDRRKIARVVTALQIGCAAVLGVLNHMGGIGLPALFSVAALLGVARAFAGPAFSALGPNLVPPEILPRAIAFNATAWQVG